MSRKIERTKCKMCGWRVASGSGVSCIQCSNKLTNTVKRVGRRR